MKIRIFKYFILLLTAGLLAKFVFLHYSWLSIYTVDEMKFNAKLIDATVPVPDNFIKVWDKLFPNSRNTGMTLQYFQKVTGVGFSNKSDCKCDEIGYLAWSNPNYNFKFPMKGVGKYWMFGFGVQKFTTPQKCFDFWLNNDIFWNGKYLKDLNELSKIQFDSDVNELKNSEIVHLIAFRILGYHRSHDTAILAKTVRELNKRYIGH